MDNVRQLLGIAVIVCLFSVYGCTSNPVPGKKSSSGANHEAKKLEGSGQPAQGRWFLNESGGEKMVRAVRNADHSVVLMAKVFKGKGSSVTAQLADALIERARAGVQVAVILPESFPVSFFNQVNERTEKKFAGTPVEFKRIRVRGKFRSNGTYTRARSAGDYVNSALLLADGVNLFAGNMIFMPGDLSGKNSNIIQLWGKPVYNETVSLVQKVLQKHDFSVELTRKQARAALEKRAVAWAPVKNLEFYLGQYMSKPLSEFFERAEHSTIVSVQNAGGATSNVVNAAIQPLLEKGGDFEFQFFYEESTRPGLTLADLFVDHGRQVYRYNEPQTQYHRFGLADSKWFYSGTVDLSLIYLQGWNYQTVVSGKSPRLVKQVKEWLANRRERARPKHETDQRFRIDTPLEELTENQRKVVKFYRNRLVPGLEDPDWNQLVEFFDNETAEWLGKRFLYWSRGRDSQISPAVYREFYKKRGMDPGDPEIRELPKKVSGGREFLRLIVNKLVKPHPESKQLLRRELIQPLRKKLVELDTPYLVEEGFNYRIYQPGLLPTDENYGWSVTLVEKDDKWRVHFE